MSSIQICNKAFTDRNFQYIIHHQRLFLFLYTNSLIIWFLYCFLDSGYFALGAKIFMDEKDIADDDSFMFEIRD
jgi:hypothetical protein